MSTLNRVIAHVPRSGSTWLERSRSIIAIAFETTGLLLLIGLGIGFFSIGFTTVATVYWVFATLLVLNVLTGVVFRRIELAKFNAMTLMLVMPYVLMFHFGGFTPLGVSAGVLSLSSPIIAMLLVKRERAVPWIIGAAAGIVVMIFLQGYAAQNDPQIPSDVANLFVAIHVALFILTVSGLSFIVTGRLEEANRRADHLLLNVLPEAIAERLKDHPEIIADSHPEVTVLFADIVDFTTMSAGVEPEKVVTMLNGVFSELDQLAAKHGLEKVKTIGDAYMVAGGIPNPMRNHTEAVLDFATELLDALERWRAWNDEPIRMRVGVDTGPVVAGVIGRQKFIYDLWGDVVNTASRMESNGLTNVIQVTESVYQKLRDTHTFEERPPIDVKGKGMMTTYLLKV